MIRVTVEILPFGDKKYKRTLGVMYIANDASGDESVGNYDVYIEGKTAGKVKGHRRPQGFWKLIRSALEEL
jgi:hypothetical protein